MNSTPSLNKLINKSKKIDKFSSSKTFSSKKIGNLIDKDNNKVKEKNMTHMYFKDPHKSFIYKFLQKNKVSNKDESSQDENYLNKSKIELELETNI